MIDPTKTTPEKLAEMNDSLIVDNNYLRGQLLEIRAENEALKQQVEQGKRDAVPEGYTLVPTEILDRFPEINPSNYDHDDACALNAWGVELVLAAAPKQEK